MLKNVTVAGQEILLRSVNGRDWFKAPADLIAYNRQQAKLREELRGEWNGSPERELCLPTDTFPCGVKL